MYEMPTLGATFMA